MADQTIENQVADDAEGECETGSQTSTETPSIEELMARIDQLDKTNRSLQRNYEQEKHARRELLAKVETEEERAARERAEYAEELASREQTLAEQGRRLARASVMVKHQIPAELEGYLHGETEEDVEAAWKGLSATLEKLAKDIRTKTATTNAPTAGDSPATDFSKMSIDEATAYIRTHPEEKAAVLAAIKRK